MAGAPRKTRFPLQYLILGLMLVVLITCNVPPDSNPPPPPGGFRINITGYPDSFFDGRICHYAICEFGGDPKLPADRVAEGTISLNSSGSGTSKVENLEAGDYNVYVAVDVEGTGFTYSGGYPSDGDLHASQTNITVNDIVDDRYFTLKAVTGTVSWAGEQSGDLYLAICTHDPGPPKGISIAREVDYPGITSATSATYCIDATEQSGSFYLWGNLVVLVGWYDDADGFAGPSITGPVDVDPGDLADSYDFTLAP